MRDIERAPYIRVKLKSVCREHSDGWQDRTGQFVLLIYSLQHLIRPQFTVILLKLIWFLFFSTLVWPAPGAEAKQKCASEKSPVLCGHKGICRFRVLINVFLVKKKKGQNRQFWVGWLKGWPSLGQWWAPPCQWGSVFVLR